jgi:hypothetical protein
MVNNLPHRHEKHAQVGDKRNIMNMKGVKTRSALSSNKKKGSIRSMSLIKPHNISSKIILYTDYENCTSPSILIKPSLVCMKLRLIRS